MSFVVPSRRETRRRLHHRRMQPPIHSVRWRRFTVGRAETGSWLSRPQPPIVAASAFAASTISSLFSRRTALRSAHRPSSGASAPGLARATPSAPTTIAGCTAAAAGGGGTASAGRGTASGRVMWATPGGSIRRMSGWATSPTDTAPVSEMDGIASTACCRAAMFSW